MIYIHIGMHKAGSTSVQFFMARNAEALAEHGIVYPRLGRGKGVAHHQLSRAMVNNSGSIVPPIWDRARRVFQRSRAEAIVLSSEGFENADPAALRNVLDDLDVKIICYVRDTTKRIPSAYTQDTKYGFNIDDFDVYFDRIGAFTRPKWLYSKYLHRWAAAFGVQNLKVRSLEPECLADGDLLADFLSNFGLERAAFPAAEFGAVELNTSPGWKVVEALRAINGRVDFPGMPRDKRNDPAAWAYFRQACDEAVRIGADMGWTERGLYLNREQNERLIEAYNAEIAEIETMGIDAAIAPLRRNPEDERLHLPDASQIAADEFNVFLLQLMPAVSAAMIQTLAREINNERGEAVDTAGASTAVPRTGPDLAPRGGKRYPGPEMDGST